MKFYFEVTPEDIHIFAFILESYEDCGVITTEKITKKNGGVSSVIVANVADDYVELFHKIVESLDEMNIKVKKITDYKAEN
ncbi:MAG: hypothetical protein QMC67_11115 [Candidatus Wallbacteria bacterium]